MTPDAARIHSWAGQPSRSSGHARRPTGLAAIEFVMALTVILFLLVALLWIGRVAVNTMQATVAARHDAWTHRPQAQPRSFDFTDLEGGRIRGVAKAPVSVSPLFDGRILPSAEQTIIGGSWDHRRERLSRSPNRRLYPVLLRNMLASGTGVLADMGGLLGAFADNAMSGLEDDREAEKFQRDEEQRERERERIRQQQAVEEARANEKWNQELDSTIRKINAETDIERRKVTAIDQELAMLDRTINQHAAKEPKDAEHRERMAQLERQRDDLRQKRREPVERIRRLEELEAEVRRQKAS